MRSIYGLKPAGFTLYTTGLNLKDNIRDFDYGQKLAIYHRDKGLCYFCKKEVNFNNSNFHHKKSWSDGGPTTVENGVLSHSSCHEKYHAKNRSKE